MKSRLLILFSLVSLWGYSQTSTGWFGPNYNGLDSIQWPYNTISAYADGGGYQYTCPACVGANYPRTHTWTGFGFPVIPVGATIDSIGVRLDGLCTTGSTIKLYLDFSYDGGAHYTTSTDYISFNSATEATKYDYGLYGRVWDSDDFTDANFVFKVRAVSAAAQDPYVTGLDWIQINVYYTPSAGTGECATARWLFENDWTDEENNYDFTAYNSPTFGSASPTAVEGTYYGDFESAGATPDYASTDSIDLTSGGLTLSFNIYPFAVHSEDGNVSIFYMNKNVSFGYFSVMYGNETKCIYVSGDGSNTALTPNNTLGSDTWNHVVIRSYDVTGNYITIWVNGVMQSSADSSIDAFACKRPLFIGDGVAGGTPASNDFNGYVDNVQLYKWAATDAQIQDLYVHRADGDYEICEGETEPTIVQGYHLVVLGESKYNWIWMSGTKHSIKGELRSSEVDLGVYRDIGHYQTAICPSDAVVDDYIVELNYNRNWTIRNGTGELTYTKLGGSDYFTVSPTAGVIICLSAPPAGTIQTVEYAVIDGEFTDTASVDIRIIDVNYCIYFDLDAMVSGAGTRASPRITLPDTYTSGYYYLLRRGTGITKYSKLTIASENVTIGAYGTGPKPVINFSVNISVPGYNGSIEIFGYDDITIRDVSIVDVLGVTTTVMYVGSTADNFVLDNVFIQGVYTSTFQIAALGQIAGGGIKNCELRYAQDDAIHGFGMRGTGTSNRFIIEGNYIHDINSSATLLNGDCLDMGNQDNRWTHIRYNYFDRSNTEFKHCMVIGMDAAHQGVDCGSIVEYNYCTGYTGASVVNQNGISIYGSYGLICRYNEIYNIGGAAIFTPTEDAVNPWTPGAWTESGNRDLQIYDNLIVNNEKWGIQLEANCDSSAIYNNTFYNYSTHATEATRSGVFIRSACNGVKIKNNIFYTTSANFLTAVNGSVTAGDEDYNCFSPDGGVYSPYTHSVEGSPGLVEGEHSAYEINSNSTNTYHTGTDLNIAVDMWGDAFHATTPSMGYKEYIP